MLQSEAPQICSNISELIRRKNTQRAARTRIKEEGAVPLDPNKFQKKEVEYLGRLHTLLR